MSYLATLLGDAFKEGMAPEEIEKALEAAGVGVPTPPSEGLDKEVERLKQALSKSNSENADWKKKLREKQTEEERKAQEDAEKLENLQQAYNGLLQDKTLSENKSQLLALGYEETLATETAQAMLDGDTAKVFSHQKKHLENQEKALRASILKETPAPPAGAGSGEVDYQKKIEEAQSLGNHTEAAYYTRLMAQEENQTTE